MNTSKSSVPKLTDFAAVIFDMDGLVLDTESTYSSAWQSAIQFMGYDFRILDTHNLSGLGAYDVNKQLFNVFGSSFDVEAFNRHSSRFWYQHVNQQGIQIKPGFWPLHTELLDQQIPFCLATNSFRKNAEECLHYAGLSHVFKVIICQDDVTHGKPAPDIFLQAAECLKVTIENCLVLEDSYTGICGGYKAGAYVVLVSDRPPSHSDFMQFCHLKLVTLNQVLETFRN